MRALPWVKLWWDWYATRAHLGLGPKALHTGPFLMQLANAGEREDTGAAWLTVPQDNEGTCPGTEGDMSRDKSRTTRGRPLGIEAIARVSRWSIEEMREILAELVEAGTMVVRDDGAYGFPRFLDFQESPEAKRKRIQRLRVQQDESVSPAKRGHVPDSEGTCPGTNEGTCPGTNPTKRTEDRDQNSEINSPPQPGGGGGPGFPEQRARAKPAPAPPPIRDESAKSHAAITRDEGAEQIRPPIPLRPSSELIARAEALERQQRDLLELPPANLRSPPIHRALYNELDLHRRIIAAAKPDVDLPRLSQHHECLIGFTAAVDEYGYEHVREICEHTWTLVTDGKLERGLACRMFKGDGFEARRDAWLSSQRKSKDGDLSKMKYTECSGVAQW